jgi:pimeloyl-ACP methyl ester carboxylesterase
VRFGSALLVLTLATAGTARSSAAPVCDNLFGERCRISLSSGIHMSYFEAGPQNGETLILLHTDTTSAVEWAWTVAALVRLNPTLHVYALDQRGAGTTDLPATATCWSTPNRCLTLADLAADVLAFMQARAISRATLVGHALGAEVARHVALAHPERVVRLILSGTGVPGRTPPGSAVPGSALESLGWRKMLEAKGGRWPQGALHMRPLDIDPDAVRNLTEHWDISVIAAPEVVQTIAAQSAMQWLSGWGVLDPSTPPPAEPDRLEDLAVPTLVLWGSEDFYLTRESQQDLIRRVRQAAGTHPGMYFYWKQYGMRSAPRSRDKHDADDIGHNLSWEAPAQLAADIDSFVRTGAPTRDRYRVDAPAHLHSILVEPGKATVISSTTRIP